MKKTIYYLMFVGILLFNFSACADSKSSKETTNSSVIVNTTTPSAVGDEQIVPNPVSADKPIADPVEEHIVEALPGKQFILQFQDYGWFGNEEYMLNAIRSSYEYCKLIQEKLPKLTRRIVPLGQYDTCNTPFADHYRVDNINVAGIEGATLDFEFLYPVFEGRLDIYTDYQNGLYPEYKNGNLNAVLTCVTYSWEKKEPKDKYGRYPDDYLQFFDKLKTNLTDLYGEPVPVDDWPYEEYEAHWLAGDNSEIWLFLSAEDEVNPATWAETGKKIYTLSIIYVAPGRNELIEEMDQISTKEKLAIYEAKKAEEAKENEVFLENKDGL